MLERATGFVAAAVTAVVLAGCSSSTAPADTNVLNASDLNTALAKVPSDMSTVRGLDLPLDRSLLTPVEELEIVKARNTLMEQCLGRYRITYIFPPMDPKRDAAKPRRYGLIDSGEANTYGYRDPAVFETRESGEAPQQPSPDVVSVITGTHRGKVGGLDVPAGGCAGEADRVLAADALPGQEPVSFALSSRSLDISRSTPPVIAAAGAWSRCMAEAGFDYRDPDIAINDPDFSAGRASRHEIAVAVHDVQCKERVQWVQTWVAVERVVQDQLIQQHAADLARERQHKEQQLATARKING